MKGVPPGGQRREEHKIPVSTGGASAAVRTQYPGSRGSEGYLRALNPIGVEVRKRDAIELAEKIDYMISPVLGNRSLSPCTHPVKWRPLNVGAFHIEERKKE